MTYAAGIITTCAGTGEQGYTGDGGPAAQARLSEPFMCAFDAQGNLYVAEATNHCVRRIDYQTGIITTRIVKIFIRTILQALSDPESSHGGAWQGRIRVCLKLL